MSDGDHRFLLWTGAQIAALSKRDARRATAARARLAEYFDTVGDAAAEVGDALARGDFPHAALEELAALRAGLDAILATNFELKRREFEAQAPDLLSEFRGTLARMDANEFRERRCSVTMAGLDASASEAYAARAAGRARGLAALIRALGPGKPPRDKS